MKITKKSLSLLKKHGRMLDRNREMRKEYDYRIGLIIEILQRSEIICGNTREGFEICNSDNLAVCLVNENEKPILRGMSTRYGCISCTFTHGLNQVEITDPDKLIRSIADEI